MVLWDGPACTGEDADVWGSSIFSSKASTPEYRPTQDRNLDLFKVEEMWENKTAKVMEQIVDI